MLKVAALILDAHDDADGKVARNLAAELHQLPLASQEEIDALPDSQFALVMKTAGASATTRRRFPLHNPDAVKLSEAYFALTKSALPAEVVKVAERKFAEIKAGVTKTVAFVDLSKVAAAPRLNTAVADRVFGLTIGDRSYYPLHDAQLVKQAVEKYPLTIRGMEPDHRFVYAREIQKQASKHRIDVPADSLINRYTNPSFNIEALATGLQQRKTAAKDRSTVILDQLAEAFGIVAPQGGCEHNDSFATRSKTAVEMAGNKLVTTEHAIALLQQFDKLAGISEFEYNRGLLDPFASCFKLADMQTGAFVDGVNLSAIDPQQLQQHLTPEFVTEFQSNPIGTYQRLPPPLKAIVRDLAQKVVPRQNRDGATDSPGDPINDLNPVYSNQHSNVRGY